ncbi:hypothetical protein AB205_0211170, partial [Aquarana catesbeiana]
MMSHGKNTSLTTQEDVRRRLYQTFKSKGVLDSLKTQLRNQLIQDLNPPAHSKEQLHSSDTPSNSLVHQVCNSLVADHMRRCGYEYSLSVFYPECGLEKEKVLNMHDLMQLMKISPKCRLHHTLILTELIDHHLSKDGRDVDTQTVTTSPYQEELNPAYQKMVFYPYFWPGALQARTVDPPIRRGPRSLKVFSNGAHRERRRLGLCNRTPQLDKGLEERLMAVITASLSGKKERTRPSSVPQDPQAEELWDKREESLSEDQDGTDDSSSVESVEKLKFIDEQFDELYPKRPKFESIEGKLIEYRRELEEQLQEEMTQKLKHFKDVDIAKIKLEEREKCQKEISDLRRELEKTYQSKMEGLVTREKNAVERLQRQQENYLGLIYTGFSLYTMRTAYFYKTIFKALLSFKQLCCFWVLLVCCPSVSTNTLIPCMLGSFSSYCLLSIPND